jgi:hypothetical protein
MHYSTETSYPVLDDQSIDWSSKPDEGELVAASVIANTVLDDMRFGLRPSLNLDKVVAAVNTLSVYRAPRWVVACAAAAIQPLREQREGADYTPGAVRELHTAVALLGRARWADELVAVG